MKDPVYTAEMGQPPMEPDGGSARPGPKRMMPPAAKKTPGKKPAPKGIRGGVWTEDSGVPVPQDIDGASAKPYKKGGSVGSASRRADGCAQRGKTKGRML